MKSGFAAILGRPNVGKSTFLNQALGRKVAIVSRKPGTTRMRVLGIRNTSKAQTVFIDTPGAPGFDSLLNQYLKREIEAARANVDAVLFMTDTRRNVFENDKKLLKELSGSLVFLVINKVDQVPREELLPVIKRYNGFRQFDEVFPISALTGENVEQLLNTLEHLLPIGDPFFPTDMITNQAEEEMAGELIREQVVRATSEELPYASAVEVEKIEPDIAQDRLIVMATLYVEKESQKPILIGRKGQMIKRIGSAARSSLESWFGSTVYLDLRVRVKKNWSRQDRTLRELGFYRR